MVHKSKYSGKVHVNPDTHDVKFVGCISANTIKEFKDNARKLANNWGYYRMRIHVECENTCRSWYLIS